MCAVKSPWNKLGRPIAPFRWLGVLIIWPAATLWLIGYFLQFGTWPHWASCEALGDDCWEYVPRTAKTPHFIPPILFEGDRRRLQDRRRGPRRESDRET